MDVFEVLEDIEKHGLIPGRSSAPEIESIVVLWSDPDHDIRVVRQGVKTHRVLVGGTVATLCWDEVLAKEFARGVRWAIEHPSARA